MAIALARPLIQNAAQVVAAEQKKQADMQALLPISMNSKLSGHIKKCWDDAYNAKREVQSRMLSCARRRKNEYEPSVLAAIREETEGSEVYIPATNLKCTVLHDYIMDVYKAGERPWSIAPTPVPELPMDLQEQVVTRVQQEIMAAPEPLSEEQILELDDTARKEIAEALKDTAKERAERMTLVIEDSLVEGKWLDVLDEVVDDIATYPAGILKGPIVRMGDCQYAVQNDDGTWEIKVKQKIVKEFDRVSPFDFYPERNVRDINDGYTLERLRLTRRKLTEMKGLKGYSDTEIDAVLSECASGGLKTNWMITQNDTEGDEAEERTIFINSPEGRIDGLEFWGSIPGEWLIEWGMSKTKIDDPHKEYQITAILIGTHVIRAALNVQPLGKKPYHMVSFRRVSGTVWGYGLPELVADIQDAMNANARALINNAAIASGPQIAGDTALLPIGEDYEHLRPWKFWAMNSGEQMNMNTPARLPIEFFQPSMQSDALINIVQYFTKMMDEYTGIPSYTHGVASEGGAASTASGQAMLMTAQGKIIKNVINHIDAAIIEPAITRLYEHEMQYNPDMGIKGDAKIHATGSGALIAKEQKLIRLRELMDSSRNDVTMQIIGLPGYAELLRKVYHAYDLDIDDIIPDEKELMVRDAMMQAAIQAKSMPATANLQPPGAQTLDVAGQPVVGQDTRMFSQNGGA